MRRLYSTFAHGLPGVGLLVMRLGAGTALIDSAIERLRAGLPIESAVLHALAACAGVFLAVGLWTPIAGGLVAIIGIWTALSRLEHSWTPILLGTLGAALVMLGPGAWSLDARRFGWKRINVGDRGYTQGNK